MEFLENEIDSEHGDMGRIKVIFRAIKIAKPQAIVEFIKNRFSEIAVLAKETCLVMEAIENETLGCFDGLLDKVINAILAPPASSVQLIRTWLLEIFVRGIIEVPVVELKKIESLPGIIDKRQLLLIRGRSNDQNYFRKQKTAIHSFANFDLPYLVWGASCLPKDEYEKWLDTVKGSFHKPLGILFLKWAASNKTGLISKLEATTIDHPE